jgi:hypothetical protein
LPSVHFDRLAKEATMKTRTHRFAGTLAAGVATLAIAAPPAGAVPAGPDPPSSGEAGTAPVVQSIDEGIDLGSAAIGAGAAGALMLLVSVGGTTYRRRHGAIADDEIGVTR